MKKGKKEEGKRKKRKKSLIKCPPLYVPMAARGESSNQNNANDTTEKLARVTASGKLGVLLQFWHFTL